MGLVRDLSSNNTPMLTALYILFSKRKLNLLNKIALEEGFFILFVKLIFESKEIPTFLTPSTLFEYSKSINI